MDLIKPEFLKKLTKFIIFSIWVLSLLTTHNFYSYRFIIQLVTHAVDKKYMFLLCNGLLVFVAKYSRLIASSETAEESWSKTDKTFHYRDFDSYDPILDIEYYSVHERGTDTFLAEEVNESQEDYETVLLHVDSTEEEDAKDEETEERDEVEEYDEPSTNNADVEEECDGLKEEEENMGVITEEDMNKKFDGFIRKMKEELRIEARRHLILV